MPSSRQAVRASSIPARGNRATPALLAPNLHHLLSLQRQVGNRAVQRVLALTAGSGTDAKDAATRHAERLRARQAAEQAASPTIPTLYAGAQAGPLREAPQDDSPAGRHAERLRERKGAEQAGSPPLPTLYAGAQAGPLREAPQADSPAGRYAERLRERKGAEQAGSPSLPTLYAGNQAGPVHTAPLGSPPTARDAAVGGPAPSPAQGHLATAPFGRFDGGMSYPASLPPVSEGQRSRYDERVRNRHAAEASPPGPTLHLGASAGPALDEAAAAAEWNATALPLLDTAVGVCRTQHASWTGTLATVTGAVPTIARLLLDPGVPGRLATLEGAGDDFDRVQAAQKATPTVAGFHATRAAHDRVQQAAADPELVAAFGPTSALSTIVATFAGLPADVRTAIEGSGAPIIRLLTRLPIAEVGGLGTIPAAVIDRFVAKTTGEVRAAIANRVSAPAEATQCRAAFTTQLSSLPTMADLPETMCADAGRQLHDKFKGKVDAARQDGLARRRELLAQTGGLDDAKVPRCTQLWFVSPAEAAAFTARVNAAAIAPARFKSNVITAAGLLQATPVGGNHCCYWYLSKHLSLAGGADQGPKLDQILTDLAANVPGWTVNAPMAALLNTAYYLFTGLGQSSVTQPGPSRGAGVLVTVRHDPAATSAWMTHLRTLRGLALAQRHTHVTVRVFHGTTDPNLHTTDPAKLGAEGSKHADPDRKRGARTLSGAAKGYEYEIPGLSGSRLIEIPRGDATWADANWYVSLEHYHSYKLITNLP